VPIVAGPALVGAALGLSGGAAQAATQAITTPAIILGVAALMLPALYIGAAFLGVAPGARVVAQSSVAALADMGIVLLGLAAPLLFLVAASTHDASVRLLGVMTLGLGLLLGFRSLYMRLFEQRSLRAWLLFTAWAIVSAGIGAQI
jgi:hypothetical protein